MTYVVWLFKKFSGSESFFRVGATKTASHCVTVIGVEAVAASCSNSHEENLHCCSWNRM